jgi:gamma-glutamyl:cysteine ligase YbdK (ATP-grasp superfamily)
MPAEFHVIWFPSEDAFDAYLRDQRRAEMLSRHGDVFTNKVVVRLDPIAPEPNSFRS